MLEFVTLRSEFCDTYFCVCDTHFRDLGGAKMIWRLKNFSNSLLKNPSSTLKKYFDDLQKRDFSKETQRSS